MKAKGISFKECEERFDDFSSNYEKADDCWSVFDNDEGLPTHLADVTVHEVTAWVVVGEDEKANELRRWLKRNS